MKTVAKIALCLAVIPITSGITVVDNSRFLNGFMVWPLYRWPWDKAYSLFGYE